VRGAEVYYFQTDLNRQSVLQPFRLSEFLRQTGFLPPVPASRATPRSPDHSDSRDRLRGLLDPADRWPTAAPRDQRGNVVRP
jgi:hypothetical protein